MLLIKDVHSGRLPFGVISNRRFVLREAFVSPRFQLQQLRSDDTIQRLRGGSTDVDDDEGDGSDKPVTEPKPSGASTETTLPETTGQGGNDKEEEHNSEDEDSEATINDENPISSVMSMEPVPVTVKTSLGSPLLDQSIDLTMHRSRDVTSLKQSISRALPGRPPVSLIQLTLDGRPLRDDIMINELVEGAEDDDDDDEVEDDERRKGLLLQLDMVPPVDPKSVSHLPSQMQELNVAELLDAYVRNEAALYQNAAMMFQAEREPPSQDGEPSDDLERSMERSKVSMDSLSKSVTVQLQQHASQIRRDLEEKLLSTDQAKKLLQDCRAPASISPNLHEREVRGQRVRQAAAGGVRTTFKRKVQRNLNVHWGDTLRHFCLFLFFGWFGGRTPFSRAILLLGAPSVFLLQARPVKLWLRQALYAILGQPPSILLSLLPAPQQALLSLDVDEAMRTIYGKYATELAADPTADQKQRMSTADKVVGSTYSGATDADDEYDEYDDEEDED